jgi:hypothetical protein
MKRVKYVIASVYDTETCNIGDDEKARAYPILFIDNDIRDIDLYNYEPDRDDKIYFYRYEDEMHSRIDEYVEWGIVCNVVPIICAYNLMFDLQPLMEVLNERYEIRANAQSSTNVYTLDLYKEGNIVLRFWDTYHLEMRGLSAMGKTCGIGKATGDWDYSLIRTPETELTSDEIYYARRDVQVIPAYLKYLLHANEWMRQSDLGFRVLTKTSIVRQMAKREIERLTVPKADGSKLELRNAFMSLCQKELPSSYQRYALRKACFRGGFTFTSARYALTIQRNVVSADVTSMHHAHLNGKYVPQDFKYKYAKQIMPYIEEVLNTSRESVLKNYHKPFRVAFHVRLRIKNIRLKKGTCFEDWCIALEPSSKFKKKVVEGLDIGVDPANCAQENSIRANGWVDQYTNAEFAFGKLYSAEEIIIHVSELELWCMGRVYEWDSIEYIYGEATTSFKLPPDFVTLQSNKLYEQKNAAKFINSHYVKGVPYPYNVSGMPEGIAKALKEGTMEPQFFESYYNSTVKGQFNGIYGTQAQDVFKPSYKCVDGNLVVDEDTITTPDNFNEKKPKKSRVLYTYGMRIVGGSRMHMIIAMELIYDWFGNRVRVLGGDTDSMKMACDESVTDAELETALKPIADASKLAIDKCMARLRKNFPDMASSLKGIGAFEIENAGKHYPIHYELWNKARISWDGKHVHVTCAGLPRPIGMYHIETFMEELIHAGNNPERVFVESIGFDTFVYNNVSHTLEHRKPKPTDIYNKEVTDYLGKKCRVFAHESTALYPAGRWLGESIKSTNRLSIDFLLKMFGRKIDTVTRYINRNAESGKAELLKDTANGIEVIMRG